MAIVHETLVANKIADWRLVCPSDHASPFSEGYYFIPPTETDHTAASRDFAKWVLTQTKQANSLYRRGFDSAVVV